MMRVLLFAAAAVLLFFTFDEIRSFDSMSDPERLRIGSAQLLRACAVASNAHEQGPLDEFEIRRGIDYLAYVTAHAADGDLDRYIEMSALRVCLDGEGESERKLERLILSAGSDEQVDAIIQSTADPRSYCTVDFTESFTPHEAERLRASCRRLGLRWRANE